MDLIEKSIDESKDLSDSEKKIIAQLYLEVVLDPDNPNIENKFDKILEKSKYGA